MGPTSRWKTDSLQPPILDTQIGAIVCYLLGGTVCYLHLDTHELKGTSRTVRAILIMAHHKNIHFSQIIGFQFLRFEVFKQSEGWPWFLKSVVCYSMLYLPSLPESAWLAHRCAWNLWNRACHCRWTMSKAVSTWTVQTQPKNKTAKHFLLLFVLNW